MATFSYLCIMKRKIRIIWSGFEKFMRSLTSEEQTKAERYIALLATEERLPEQRIKRLHGMDGLYELRVNCMQKTLRFLFFYDEMGNAIVVMCNAFKKKTQKTPQQEIELAKRLRNEYLRNS